MVDGCGLFALRQCASDKAWVASGSISRMMLSSQVNALWELQPIVENATDWTSCLYFSGAALRSHGCALCAIAMRKVMHGRCKVPVRLMLLSGAINAPYKI